MYYLKNMIIQSKTLLYHDNPKYKDTYLRNKLHYTKDLHTLTSIGNIFGTSNDKYAVNGLVGRILFH